MTVTVCYLLNEYRRWLQLVKYHKSRRGRNPGKVNTNTVDQKVLDVRLQYAVASEDYIVEQAYRLKFEWCEFLFVLFNCVTVDLYERDTVVY